MAGRLFCTTPVNSTDPGPGDAGGIVVESSGTTLGSNAYIEFVTQPSPGYTRLTFLRATNGNAVFNADVTAFGTFAPSDINLKENIKDIEDPLKKVLSIRGITYNLKSDEDKKSNIGVIAQEIENILPEVVSESYDPSEIYSENKIKTVSYTQIIPVLVEAIKEQNKIIEDLKARVEILEKI